MPKHCYTLSLPIAAKTRPVRQNLPAPTGTLQDLLQGDFNTSKHDIWVQFESCQQGQILSLPRCLQHTPRVGVINPEAEWAHFFNHAGFGMAAFDTHKKAEAFIQRALAVQTFTPLEIEHAHIK